MHEENLSLYRYITGKGRRNATACGYSSLILHQNSTSGHVLNISYSIETGIISMNSSNAVTSKSTHLYCTISGSFPYICHLENIGL